MIPPDAIALFAIDPLGAGLILRGAPCPARDRALADLAACGLPLRRVPMHVTPERLTGGIDLAASLAAGATVQQPGLLAEAAGSVLTLAMAERWSGMGVGLVAAALDAGSLGVVALDEGCEDEALAAALADRCAFIVPVESLDETDAIDLPAIAAARRRLPGVTIDETLIAAICAAADALGVGSLRGALLATRVARAAAAYAGRDAADADDAALAARLVLGPRATRMPTADTAEDAPQADPPAPDPSDDTQAEDDSSPLPIPDDLVLEAAKAALPAWLLDGLPQPPPIRRSTSAGRAGAEVARNTGGRPVGNRPGIPRDGMRLDLIATLRTAAPWQRLRGRTDASARLRLRRDDLRIVRCKPRCATTTIFAVDASGSLALSRLAEAKGAVELLLADCYVRRDQVAVIAFRGKEASLLLPPTRAPARARRCLAALPGGGGTPIALGIDAATALADASQRRGETPTIVLLTDGQANIDRTGAAGRVNAQADAIRAANDLRARRHRCLLIDTSPRPQPLAKTLAAAMGGRYLALPRADAEAVSRAVRAPA